MKYYCMKPDFRKEVTGGIFPQIQRFDNSFYEKKMDSFTTELNLFVGNQKEFTSPNSNKVYEGFKLHGRSKPTDVISVAMFNDPIIVFNDKIAEFINRFVLPKYNINKFCFNWKKIQYSNYYVFYMLNYDEILIYIDSDKTEFAVYENDSFFDDDFSSDKLIKTYKYQMNNCNFMYIEEKIIDSKEIFFKTICPKIYVKKNIPFDIVCFGNIPFKSLSYYKNNFYSERFVEAFEKESFKGVYFEPVDCIFVEK